MFVGERKSGKSQLIHSYMYKGRPYEPKETVSLDYKYTRSSVGISAEKDLSHFWELGGGRSLVKLVEIAVTSQSVEHSMIVVAIDLSKPSRAASSLVYWLKKIKAHVGACIDKLCKKEPEARARIEARAKKEWKGHADSSKVNVSLVPVLVVATKFDEFRHGEPEPLRIMSHMLRAICHTYGASLLYHGQGDPNLDQALRSVISRHVLNRDPVKMKQTDSARAILVPAGGDTFEDIGSAPPEFNKDSSSRVNGWIAAVKKYFPATEKEGSDDLAVNDLQLSAEAQIDETVAAKDEELKRVRREAQLKRRLKLADAEKVSRK